MFKLSFDFYKNCTENWKEKIIIILYFLMHVFAFVAGIYFLWSETIIGIKIFGFFIVVFYVFVEGFVWGADF